MTKPIQVWMARKSTQPCRLKSNPHSDTMLTIRPAPGPNPWKVVVILEELQVPYEIKSIRFENIKKKPFTDLNPNGRVPG